MYAEILSLAFSVVSSVLLTNLSSTAGGTDSYRMVQQRTARCWGGLLGAGGTARCWGGLLGAGGTARCWGGLLGAGEDC